MTELINILRTASDRYGYPHLIGCLDRYKLIGYNDAEEAQLREYIQTEKLA